MGTDPNQIILNQLKDAAYEQMRKRQAEHTRISDLVLGTKRGTRRHVSELVTMTIESDYLVQVTNLDEDLEGNRVMWTFVINGKASNTYHRTQEEAVLHLIASRYDPNLNSNIHAAFYAGRVLGLPEA